MRVDRAVRLYRHRTGLTQCCVQVLAVTSAVIRFRLTEVRKRRPALIRSVS